MSKRTRVKARRVLRKSKAVINELSKGAGYALRN
jgi:hypothetical protein